MNPHRADSRYPFRGLCSAGLAYKTAQAYQLRYGEAGMPLESLLDLVALATIADVVPLQDENRRFVCEGLALISRGARCGIRALKQVAGIVRDCSAETIAYKLAPRLNAAGRLDHAMLGVQLLTTESPAAAQQLADRLEQLNRERQKIEADLMVEAVEAVAACLRNTPSICRKSYIHSAIVAAYLSGTLPRSKSASAGVAAHSVGDFQRMEVAVLDLLRRRRDHEVHRRVA